MFCLMSLRDLYILSFFNLQLLMAVGLFSTPTVLSPFLETKDKNLPVPHPKSATREFCLT